ncbi:uncharacterized protein LOC128555875 [Mercenaria mercenaria]|uniref:uncharacterized protein LOC128555875 n=1 Tax=Mercenaria mercenaria TaxID=6596 RepID=UPI00234E9311|nr:uncharacterized protein LOC128555875 [Mercenaria mercenaria]
MDGACSTEEETDSEGEEKASSSYDQPLMSHEGFSDTQTLIKEDQTKASAENHSASVAFYVRDVKTGKVYGLTNRHITLHTDKIDIKMLSQSKFIHFGTSVKILDEKSLDIGLIEIDHSVKDLLSNTENVDQNVCIYSGPFESIFDKEIFKYKPSDKLYEVCKCGTPNYGTIVSESEHEECKPENGQFLVKSENGVFAVKGESGTAVAAKRKEDNVIELVGIICGGSGDNTVCLFIPDVFHFYKNRYDMILELYDACILCGVKIYFNLSTPEQISPPSYDLVDHALNLMCYKFENVDVKIYERLIERERDLSLRVTQRLCLNDNAIFENDNPNYVAIESGMLACDFLYVGNARAAENRLKKAIFCFLKSDDFGLRLLCNLITYITWYCLVKNNDTSLDKLKKLLENGKKILNATSDLKRFPLESLGFLIMITRDITWQCGIKCVSEAMTIETTQLREAIDLKQLRKQSNL